MTTTEEITTDPACGKPVHADPRFDERVEHEGWADEPPTVEPAAAVWDLGFGACLAFGPDETGQLTVQLHIGDYTKLTGCLHRTITPAQLNAHIQHLTTIANATPEASA